jgi:glycosyltransferase involved in cell wall biosynthesis
MKKVSILIPVYNEEMSLPFLYDELYTIMADHKQYLWEILFVNDGSSDNSLVVIKSLQEHDNRICYADLSRNFGKEKALLAGFDYVTGDCMIIMDADLQHPPKIISEMLIKWEQGFDDVYGERITRGKEKWFRRNLSLLFYSLLQKTTRIQILQNVGDFRLIDRKCIEVLKQLREQERYTKGMYSWIGFNKTSIQFKTGDRIAGKSSWHFWDLVRLANEGIMSFTTAPLQISTFIGLFVSMIAFIYMIYVLIKAMIIGDPVQGYPTMIVVILFLGGIQLLSLGIIGAYVGRIFNETKNRPTYIIKEYKNNQNNESKNLNE